MELKGNLNCMLVCDYCILVVPILLYEIVNIILKAGDVMIIKLEQDLTKQEIEILIKYAQMNSELEHLTSMIKSADKKVRCEFDGNEKYINASDIYYIESVDKKTFVYCEKEVYRTEKRLYQLMDELKGIGFVQISKSCILNINILDMIKPMINSKMEAILKNGEHLLVTRKYLTSIKEELQKGVLI
jgi:DNA-binding LytR/AlgR family response regulator